MGWHKKCKKKVKQAAGRAQQKNHFESLDFQLRHIEKHLPVPPLILGCYVTEDDA